MKIEQLEDSAAVAARAAALLSAAVRTFKSDRSDQTDQSLSFSIALAGGSTPKVLYELLSHSPWKEDMPWNLVLWFLGDERFVPLHHPDSNYRMIREALLDPAAVSHDRQFPVKTNLPTPEAAAENYSKTVSDQLASGPEGPHAGVPLFNLVLLGMGDDGHTASLFPHTAALDEKQKPVVANYVEKLNAWRITITPPVLLAATERIVMVTGEGKAAALAQVLQGELDVSQYPAQLLRETRTTWLVDKAAATRLK